MGAPDLDEHEVAALQAVIVDTGAQAEAEAAITALTEQAVSAIAEAPVTAGARDELDRARVLRRLAPAVGHARAYAASASSIDASTTPGSLAAASSQGGRHRAETVSGEPSAASVSTWRANVAA